MPLNETHLEFLKENFGRNDEELINRLKARAIAEAEEAFLRDTIAFVKDMEAWNQAMLHYGDAILAYSARKTEYDSALASWEQADPAERPEWTMREPREPDLPVRPVEPVRLPDDEIFVNKIQSMIDEKKLAG